MLFESGAPTLILPQRGRKVVGRRVLIGWNQRRGTARAVRAAVPLLAAADEVTIVSCGAEDLPGPKAAEIARYLAFHGIQARRITTRGRNVDEELMAAFRDCDADLFVSGAYGGPRRGYSSITRRDTRRFLARPSSVSFVAIGEVSP